MPRTRHRLLVAVVTTLMMVLAACGGDGGDDEAADTTADTATEDADTTDDAGTGDDAGDDGATDDAADDGDDDATDDGATDAGDDATETDDTAADADSDGDAAADDTASATVAVATSDLGDILVDGDGRTLYMFLPDQADEPTCTGDCAAAWPVFEGPATAGEGADAALLSTATHPSGATQVTYAGWPLYYFASDAAPGDVNGQGVNEVWFTLGPDGEPVRDDVSASSIDREY